MDNILILHQRIIAYLKEDKLLSAIKELQLRINLDKSTLNTIISQSGRINSIEKQYHLGMITTEERNASRNLVRLSLIDLTNEIFHEPYPIVKNQNKFSFKNWPHITSYLITFIIVIGIILILILNSRNTIKGIEGNHNNNNEVIISK